MPGSTFSFTLERTSGAAVLRLSGELDMLSAASLDEAAAALGRSPVSRLEIDLGDLSFLDAAGVAPLVSLALAVVATGGVTVAVGATATQAMILAMTPIAVDRERPDRGEAGGAPADGLGAAHDGAA